MTNSFFERTILNSPYEGLRRHWELVESGQPAQKVLERRWRAGFITPISGLEAVDRKLGVGCSLVGKGIGTERLPNASAPTRAALDKSRLNHTGADVDLAVNWEARK